MHHSFEPGNKNNIPKRIMQQEEEPTSTEVPWRRSDCYSVSVCVCVCVCVCASTCLHQLFVRLCVCWLCTHACPPAQEWITHTHTHTQRERESHIISAGSPQQHIPQILLHISNEHNVLLLSCATLISGGERLLLFFSTFFFFFLPPSLLILPSLSS